MVILFAVLTVAVAVGLSILFNKLVVKDFPEADRKAGYVKTFVVFILLLLVIFGALYGKVKADAYVKSFSAKIEQDIKKHNELAIVKNGIDVGAVSKDANKLNDTVNNTVNDITRIIKPGELGVPNFVWNIATGKIKKQLQKIFTNFAAKADSSTDSSKAVANPFLDERNYLTVSSLTNGMQITILKIIRNTVIVIIVICVILLAVYKLKSLSKASKERKRLGKNAG